MLNRRWFAVDGVTVREPAGPIYELVDQDEMDAVAREILAATITYAVPALSATGHTAFAEALRDVVTALDGDPLAMTAIRQCSEAFRFAAAAGPNSTVELWTILCEVEFAARSHDSYWEAPTEKKLAISDALAACADEFTRVKAHSSRG